MVVGFTFVVDEASLVVRVSFIDAVLVSKDIRGVVWISFVEDAVVAPALSVA